jgi:hypothetical protein
MFCRIEGWHGAFSLLLSAYHSTFWKFIEALRKKQGFNKTKIEQYVAEIRPTVFRKHYRDPAQNRYRSYC